MSHQQYASFYEAIGQKPIEKTPVGAGVSGEQTAGTDVSDNVMSTGEGQGPESVVLPVGVTGNDPQVEVPTIQRPAVVPPELKIVQDWATYYAAQFGLFPIELVGPTVPKDRFVKSPGKQPANKGWTKDEKPADPRTYRNGCNLGLRMGSQPSGVSLVCLDIDSADPNERFKIWPTADDWPLTWWAKTGGGKYHVIYSWPADLELPGNTVRLPGTDIDIRSEGGQIAVCPSVHPDTGHAYQWLNGPNNQQPIQELPANIAQAILELAVRTESGSTRRSSDKAGDEQANWRGADKQLAALLARSLPEHGERHSACLMICGWLCKKGWPEDRVSGFLHDVLVGTGWDFSPTEVENDVSTTFDATRNDRPYSGRTALRELLVSRQGEKAGGYEFDELEANLDLLGKYGLQRNKEGVVQPSWENLRRIMSEHPAWRGKMRLNEFSHRIEKDGALPDRSPAAASALWDDGDATRTACWLSGNYYRDFAVERIHALAKVTAQSRSYHPVRTYLEGLAWDGKPRLGQLFSRGFGVDDAPRVSMISRFFAIGAVARIFTPGCKVDSVPIFVGGQGVGKSTACRILSVNEDWFADPKLDLASKDSIMQIDGKWIVELGELAGIRRQEVETVKAFITRQNDRVRLPYERTAQDIPRQTVFLASTNDQEILTDTTGNRRWWPMTSSRCPDIDWLRTERDQIWAEAVVAYRKGERWHPTPAESVILAEAAEEYEVHEPWLEDIANGLNRFLQGSIPGITAIDPHEGITTAFVLDKVLQKPAERRTNFDAKRVANALDKLGWRKWPTNGGKRKVNGVPVRVWLPPEIT